MKRKKEIRNPFDFSFKVMDCEFPKEFHETLPLPGKFVRKVHPKVLTKDHPQSEMDSSSIIDPSTRRSLKEWF